MLKDLSRTGEVGTTVANFIRAIASGEVPPEIPNSVPQQLRRYLRDLEVITEGGGKYFKLTGCAVDALTARLTGIPLSGEAAEMLKELELHGKAGEKVSKFFEELAAERHPQVPRGLPRGMGGFLKGALAWAEHGEVPSGLVGQIAEDCIRARFGHGEVEEFTSKALAALSATGREWNAVAVFLRKIASEEDPPVPPEAPRSCYNDLIRISYTSRVAGVQQPRILETISVGFGDPATGIDLFSLAKSLVELKGHCNSLPKEAEAAIAKFEEGAPERAVVADLLRAIVTGQRALDEPGDLPVAIRLVLLQIEAVAKDAPIPLDPSLVGFAAIRSRHGGGPMGDCILLSLRALAAAGKEERSLAEYLWTVANRGPAGPAPALSDQQLAATAEEVRCLADPEVGGFRLMMSPATESIEHGGSEREMQPK